MYKRIRNLNLPTDLQIKLFDHTIVPILLYGCEVWGFQNAQVLENVHNELLRNILKLRKSTPLYTLHAELGWIPLILNIKSCMIGYWISVINGKNSMLTKVLYTILVHEHGNYDFKWVKWINDILVSVGKVSFGDIVLTTLCRINGVKYFCSYMYRCVGDIMKIYRRQKETLHSNLTRHMF